MKAKDWFKDEYEFRQLCGDAQSQARGESSQNFAAEMVINAKTTGLETYLSYKQLEWLCKIADWDIPKPTHQVDEDDHDGIDPGDRFGAFRND